jgi:hypothetical protein
VTLEELALIDADRFTPAAAAFLAAVLFLSTRTSVWGGVAGVAVSVVP